MAKKRKVSRSAAGAGRARRGDLRAIEKRLNSDADARAAFLKNPVTYMSGQGVDLSPKAKTDLKNLVQDMKQSPRLAEGAAIRRPGITIMISIRIEF